MDASDVDRMSMSTMSFTRPSQVAEKSVSLGDRLRVVAKQAYEAVFGPSELTDRIIARYNWQSAANEINGDVTNEAGYDFYDGKKERPKHFVDHTYFSALIGVLIASNAVTIGLARHVEAIEGKTSQTYQLVEMCFCFVFFVELVLRFRAYGMNYFFLPGREVTNLFDFFIVVLTCLDTFVFQSLGATGGELGALSLLRFVRLYRVIRLARMTSFLKDLWLLTSGLFRSLKYILFGFAIFACVVSIAALFFTVSIGQKPDVWQTDMLASGVQPDLFLAHMQPFDIGRSFGTVFNSVVTLFQVASRRGNDGVTRRLIANEPWFFLIVVLLVGFSSLGLLNIIVGAVVENVISANTQDVIEVRRRIERDRAMIYKDLSAIFEASDTDGSGSLCIEEVMEALNTPSIYSKLKAIDFPVEMPDKIFDHLDFDNSKEVTTDEFINGCMRMRGDAKSKDLLAAQIALDKMKMHYERCTRQMNAFQNKIAVLDSVARGLIDHGERLFLNKQEYRSRHPYNRKSTPQAISNARLNDVPWHHEEDYDQYLPGVVYPGG
jgi:hypothetical protein